ncbi:MAG: hypothetical protein COC01_01030 [Bacteroidetes bacterium]|nr:helix-turn-helix transcriptional regulator [Bacteroidia bacterium]PCH69702.1 MAG: hypothetical protein COC01_01030 [Bacteroidota bacterium]
MSNIGSNIRKIRSVKGLSQSAFADLFGLTRASIGAYEELRAEPKIDVVIEIANYFSIPLSDVFTKDLTVNQLTNFHLSKKIKIGQGLGDSENYLLLDFISAELLMNKNKLFEQLKEGEDLHQIQFPKVVDKADKFIELKGLLIPGVKNQHTYGLICFSIKQASKNMTVLALSNKRIVLGEYVSGKNNLTLKLLDSQEDTLIEGIQKLFEVKLIVSLPAKPSSNLAERLLTIEERIKNLEGNS